MKLLLKVTLIASLFFISLPQIDAQKNLKEGRIEYEVTNIDSESMEAQMMKGTLINVDFNQDKFRFNVQMMGGMVVMDIISETATENTTMLMNMMGRKVQVNQPEEEEKPEKVLPDFEITYDKKDTKEIAGEKCVKATLKDKASGETMVVYVAKGLNAKVKMAEEMFPGLEGIPMEIIISAEGMGATITAQNLSKELKAGAFDIPEGYEQMTPEEFQKEMGGMGNFGF